MINNTNIGTPSHPNIHIHPVIQQEHTLTRQTLDTQINTLGHQYPIGTQILLTIVIVITTGIGETHPRIRWHIVNRVHPRIHEPFHIPHIQRVQSMHRLDTFVGMNIGTTSKRHILQQREGVQRQQLQIFRNIRFGCFGRGSGLVGISRNDALVTPECSTEDIEAGLLETGAGIQQPRLERHLEGLTRQQTHERFHIDALDNLAHQSGDGQGLCQHPDPTLTLTGRKQERALDGNHPSTHTGLVVGKIESESGIGRAIRQR